MLITTPGLGFGGSLVGSSPRAHLSSGGGVVLPAIPTSYISCVAKTVAPCDVHVRLMDDDRVSHFDRLTSARGYRWGRREAG